MINACVLLVQTWKVLANVLFCLNFFPHFLHVAAPFVSAEAKESDDEAIDLNCQEHVSDSETDSTHEEDGLIENRAFPQQRFSPVMKHTPSEIPHRPKPIKRIPDSAAKGDSSSPAGGLISHQSYSDGLIPRPSSNGSNFQPKGAVFKAQTKTRFMSAGSVADFNQQCMNEYPSQIQRGASVSSARAGLQQPVKLHNITMSTGAEQKIIMSSNTETTLGSQNGRGPIVGKFPQKSNKPVGKPGVQMASQPVLLQQVAVSQYGKPLTTAVHIVATPQPMVSNAGQIHSSVATTFSTTASPIPASRQSITVHPQTPTANLKGSTFVIQGIPASQYNIIVSTPNLMSPTGTKIATIPVSSTHYVTTTLQNSPQHARNNSVGAPAVLTNYVIKQNHSSQPGLNSPPAPAVSPAYSQPSVQPTHVQYILPSVRMQTPNQGGKIQNHVIQMALPGTAVPPGSIHLTFTGTPAASAPSVPHSQSQVQQVQVSPQQVQTGKIQLPIQGFKVVSSPGKPQPSPAASPQLNVMPQTIQVINQTVPSSKQQAVPMVTQLVTLNQAGSIIATPQQQVQLQSVTLSQPVVSRTSFQQSQNSHIQVSYLLFVIRF